MRVGSIGARGKRASLEGPEEGVPEITAEAAR